MGGFAFASGPNPLRTPRMPLAVYLAVKSRCRTILKQYYAHVATPIEAPGKIDYGDVDFLVASPTLLCRGSNIAETIGNAFGADRSIRQKGSSIVNFALPRPRDSQGADFTASHLPSDEGDAGVFVQVDVHVCRDKEDWDWEVFQHAHGDLWNILGTTIRPLGLTINNVGLFLRVEEVDQIDRKRSMVLLTKSPSDVLSFLGLDESQWWHQFDNGQAMFEYAASCRYFSANDAVKEVDDDKRALKANDRRRMRGRTLFKKWVAEFVPQCRASGSYSRPGLSRVQTRVDAFQCFGVKDEYDRTLDAWRRSRLADEVWRNVIKAGIPTEDVAPDLRRASIKGLKAVVINGDLSDGVIPPKSLKTAGGFYDMEAVAEFVRCKWQLAGAIELEKQRVRNAKRIDRGQESPKNCRAHN